MAIDEKIIYGAVGSSGVTFTKPNDANRLAFEIYRRLKMFPEDTLEKTVEKSMEISLRQGITEISGEDWNKLRSHLIASLQKVVKAA
jgi:hypothetical protein